MDERLGDLVHRRTLRIARLRDSDSGGHAGGDNGNRREPGTCADAARGNVNCPPGNPTLTGGQPSSALVENSVGVLFQGPPDNAITESGVLGELKAHPIRSRVGQHRADLKHQPMDPVIVAAPWLLMGGAAYMLAKSLRARRQPERHYQVAEW